MGSWLSSRPSAIWNSGQVVKSLKDFGVWVRRLSSISAAAAFFIPPDSARGTQHYFLGATGFACFVDGFGEVYAPPLLMNSSL